ncbi:3-hydroxyacyl-CoA dehydrogenase, partial [Danaus plexippus plexippus]
MASKYKTEKVGIVG